MSTNWNLKQGFAAFALTALLIVAGTAQSWAQSANVTFLHVNDVYEISPKRGIGGLAELMTLLKAERAKAEHSVTTLGGDLISSWPSLTSTFPLTGVWPDRLGGSTLFWAAMTTTPS